MFSPEFNVEICTVSNQRIGIYLQDVSRGVSRIAKKDYNGPASLSVGDHIVLVNGRSFKRSPALARAIISAGPTVELRIRRNEYTTPLLDHSQ
jgi:C-terminal processing protease CtpA/Prc